MTIRLVHTGSNCSWIWSAVIRYDANTNLKLDENERAMLCQRIRAYLQAQMEKSEIQRKNRMLDPLVSKQATVPAEMISNYDTNQDSSLDAVELGVVATDIQKGK